MTRLDARRGGTPEPEIVARHDHTLACGHVTVSGRYTAPGGAVQCHRCETTREVLSVDTFHVDTAHAGRYVGRARKK